MSVGEKIFIIALILLAINLFFWGIVFPPIKYNYTISKQENCFHLWRRMDGDYESREPIYRYRCEKCKSEKYLSGRESKQFEKDFMSDWD